MPTRQSTELMTSESTLTSRGQTTVPNPIRKALGLTASDKIRFALHADNSVTITRVEPEPDSDPMIDRFLAFLEQDVMTNPAHVQPVPAALITHARGLTEGVEADLDAPLSNEDE